MSDEEVYTELSSDLLVEMYDHFYMGADFIELVNGTYKWIGFMDDEQADINRFLLKHAINLGTIGQVASGAGLCFPCIF